MDRDSAKQIILASLPNYLAQKGIDLSRKFLCLNPEHQDHSRACIMTGDETAVIVFHVGVMLISLISSNGIIIQIHSKTHLALPVTFSGLL